ncbi:galactofuranosyltransferase [Odoribacter lunatus]|uniref:galactofuranosyltransferase n=1 Tax=Odoribacter lunatus TaxID=2941335 RepID=UPI00203DF837|nr:galactofuranosyltransferase [Odoribacter lunatus]
MKKKKYYISHNYRSNTSAVGKAKIDCEAILHEYGYINIGLKQTINANKFYHFFRNLFSVLRASLFLPRHSTLLLQYPFKKYYPFLVYIAKKKRCNVITLIHDLRSHRRGVMSAEEEIRLFNHSDVLIVHNKKMAEWLKDKGNTSQIISLEIFDYLSDSMPEETVYQKPYCVTFAGALSPKKNSFLYQISPEYTNFKLKICGKNANQEAIRNNPTLEYGGFYNADELIAKLSGHFGLVWDGNSISTCNGQFGEYLKYNNPHKTSLYIRCHLPIIIWAEAAMGNFIQQNNIGILIHSLEELDALLSDLTEEDYQTMKNNTLAIAQRLKTGFYLKQALDKC